MDSIDFSHHETIFSAGEDLATLVNKVKQARKSGGKLAKKQNKHKAKRIEVN
jgi:hypothetical protein